MSAASVKLSKNTPVLWVHSLVSIALMFLFRLLPAPAPITEMGMAVLGAFLGIIYGWITVGMFWPSLLGLVALGFSGYGDVKSVFLEGFGSNNVLVVILMFLILGILEQAGITRWLALRIVGMKAGRGKPWVLCFLLLFAGFLLTAVSGTFTAALLVWSIFYNICEANGIEKGRYTEFVIVSVTFGSIMGSQLFPFSVPVLMMTGAYLGVAGGSGPAFVPYVLWMFFLSMVIAVLFTLAGKYLFRIQPPDMGRTDIERPKPLDRYQGIVLAALCAFLLLLLLSSVMPAAWPFTALLANLNIIGLAALVICFLLVCNFTQGKKANEYLLQAANWELVFVLACVVVLSNALGAEGTGIMAWVTEHLASVFSGHGVLLYLVLITLIPAVLTNFLNNLVVGMMFIPLSYTFSSALGVNSMAVCVALISLCSIALVTPAGCIPAAMLHGNTEWISSKSATVYGIVAVLISWVITLAVGIPFGCLLF